MGSVDCINKMHYIVDGSGNYYRINRKGQLVVSRSREEADIFNYVEANKRIGGGKKAHFYSAIPVEKYEECKMDTVSEFPKSETIPPNEDIQESETISKVPSLYDIKDMDWSEYLQHFSYIASNVHNYHNELNQALSDIDIQLCDIMHYIELYDISEVDSIRIMRLLKECREQRRDIKDEMYKIECFQNSIGTNDIISKAKSSIKKINKLSTRIYHPRKLQKLFKDCPEKTVRESRLERVFGDSTCMDTVIINDAVIIRDANNEKNVLDKQGSISFHTKEESEIMQYSRRETIFDGKENDWKQFAMQQAEFYENVEQYIYNLQSDLHEIDNEIEHTLKEIEDSKYNVTQGYKVYKQLKELRNKKKEMQKELDCLLILTVKLDCSMIAESMRSCVNEMEDV